MFQALSIVTRHDVWMRRKVENLFKEGLSGKLDRLFGHALAEVELYDIIRTEDAQPTPLERALGNYTPGRFVWLTRNCRPLRFPSPVRGRQRLFNVLIWGGQLSIESTERQSINPFFQAWKEKA
jgi:hypothetical protein